MLWVYGMFENMEEIGKIMCVYVCVCVYILWKSRKERYTQEEHRQKSFFSKPMAINSLLTQTRLDSTYSRLLGDVNFYWMGWSSWCSDWLACVVMWCCWLQSVEIHHLLREEKEKTETFRDNQFLPSALSCSWRLSGMSLLKVCIDPFWGRITVAQLGALFPQDQLS